MQSERFARNNKIEHTTVKKEKEERKNVRRVRDDDVMYVHTI